MRRRKSGYLERFRKKSRSTLRRSPKPKRRSPLRKRKNVSRSKRRGAQTATTFFQSLIPVSPIVQSTPPTTPTTPTPPQQPTTTTPTLPTPPTPQTTPIPPIIPPTPPQQPTSTQLATVPDDSKIFSWDEIQQLQNNTSVVFTNNSASCHIDSVLMTLLSMESNVFRLALLTTPNDALNIIKDKPDCNSTNVANNLRSDARKIITPRRINTCRNVRVAMGPCIDPTFVSTTAEADKTYTLFAQIFPALESQLEVCSYFELWTNDVPSTVITKNFIKINNTFDLLSTWMSFISPENWQKLQTKHTIDEIRAIMTLFSNLSEFPDYQPHNIQQVINDPKLLRDAIEKSKQLSTDPTKQSAHSSTLILEIPDWSQYNYDQITFTSTPVWYVKKYFERLDSGPQINKFKEQNLDFTIFLPNGREYELQGVVLFQDSQSAVEKWINEFKPVNGHYVSIIKTKQLGWIFYDDTKDTDKNEPPFDQLSSDKVRDYAFSVINENGGITAPVMWFYTFKN